MARAFYTIVLAATLALLATMWLRPGIAQDLIALYNGMRAQSPDSGATVGQVPGYSTLPYSSVPGAPVQPMPATRPNTWPGSPSNSYVGPINQPTASANPAGVTVWDPSGNRPSNLQNAYLPHATTNSPGGLYPPNALPPAAASLPQATATGQTSAITNSQTALLAQFAAPPVGSTPNSQTPPTAAYSAPPSSAPPTAYVGSTVGPTSPGVISPQTAPPSSTPTVLTPLGPQGLPPATLAQELPDAQIAARVASEVILVGDVKAFLQQLIEQRKMDIKPEQFDELYSVSARPLLKQLIEMKLVYYDAMHTVPPEGMKKIQANINEEFDKKQLPQMMKTAGANTRQELDAQLRQKHSSLEWERRAYLERQLYMAWVSQQAKPDVEDVQLADIIGYYRQHQADYEYKAQAKWEELMISFDKIPDKAAAEAAVGQLGNAVLQGAPFAEVAKARSHGVTAQEGGAYDWTTQGSLVAKDIDEAIFGLPQGALSKIITTDRGKHIVRVIDRKPAGRKPFEEMQNDIRKKLKDEKREKQIKKFLDDLRQKIPVETMFDKEPGGLDGPPKEDQHFL